jgi:hypothetical protein
MTLRFPLLWALTLPLAGPLAAQNVVSYVAVTPPASAANWATTLRLPAFDGTLGTLTQAKLTFTSTAVQGVRLENLGNAEGRFSYRLSSSLALDLAGRALWSTSASAATGTRVLAAFDGAQDFAGGSGFRFERTVAAVETLLETGTAELAAFTGAGELDFLASASGLTTVEGPGNLLSLSSSGVALSVELEYTYTVVPEPKGSAVLIGVLAFGLLLWGRQRRATEPERQES